jgi:hypothetical protein
VNRAELLSVKIIENAVEVLQDPAFVRDLVDLVVSLADSEWHSEWHVTDAIVVPRIFWVITNHSFNPPPTDAQLEELKRDAHTSRHEGEIVRILDKSKLPEALRKRAAAAAEIQAVKDGTAPRDVSERRLLYLASQLEAQWPEIPPSPGRRAPGVPEKKRGKKV